MFNQAIKIDQVIEKIKFFYPIIHSEYIITYF